MLILPLIALKDPQNIIAPAYSIDQEKLQFRGGIVVPLRPINTPPVPPTMNRIFIPFISIEAIIIMIIMCIQVCVNSYFKKLGYRKHFGKILIQLCNSKSQKDLPK
jgi:hypothetical protein